MATVRVSQNIAAASVVVWERLAKVTEWGTWLPTVTAVVPLDRPSLAIGAKFKVTQPKLRPAVWQVTSLDPGRSFCWESKTVGLQMWANHTVRQLGIASSSVELEFRFSGFLSPIAGLLVGALTEQYLHVEAASLKATVESSAANDAQSPCASSFDLALAFGEQCAHEVDRATPFTDLAKPHWG
jgi:hypothetical protein